MTPGHDPYASDGLRRRKTIIASIAGALVVGVLAGIGGMRLFAATRTTPSPVLTKTAAPAPVLARTAPAPTPTLDVKAETKVMPADVRAWLEHLERIERKRGELSNKGIAELRVKLASMSGGADLEALKAALRGTEDPMNAPDLQPSPVVSSTAEQTKREWDALQAEFDSLAPPAQCRALASSYRNALRETGAMTVDVLTTFDGAQQDPMAAVAKLQGMLDRKQSERIDSYGRESDGELGRICALYDTRKWFSIAEDFGGQDLLGKWAGTAR